MDARPLVDNIQGQLKLAPPEVARQQNVCIFHDEMRPRLAVELPFRLLDRHLDGLRVIELPDLPQQVSIANQAT